MPGPAFFRGPALVKDVQNGQVSEKTVDERVLKILRSIKRSGKFENPEETAEFSNPKPNKTLLRRAAEGMVLLTNEGNILPLKKSTKVALIGAAASEPVINGGGSAALNSQYKSSP